ncbi:hypothetical protein D3C85_993130 [compost metagenome]
MAGKQMAALMGSGKHGLIVCEPAIKLRQHEIKIALVLLAEEACIDQGLHPDKPVSRLVAIILKLR